MDALSHQTPLLEGIRRHGWKERLGFWVVVEIGRSGPCRCCVVKKEESPAGVVRQMRAPSGGLRGGAEENRAGSASPLHSG